jgi:hypothetical protein
MLACSTTSKTSSVVLVSKRNIPMERFLRSTNLLLTFAGRGCCTDSATDPHGRYSRFSRPEPILLLSSSWSVILRREGGTRSRHTTSENMWWRCESNLRLLLDR